MSSFVVIHLVCLHDLVLCDDTHVVELLDIVDVVVFVVVPLDNDRDSAVILVLLLMAIVSLCFGTHIALLISRTRTVSSYHMIRLGPDGYGTRIPSLCLLLSLSLTLQIRRSLHTPVV